MERRVKARPAAFPALGKQHLDRLERERLMQRGERNVALQHREHSGVDAHRRRVPRSAMHHAVDHRRGRPSAGLLYHGRAQLLQRR